MADYWQIQDRISRVLSKEIFFIAGMTRAGTELLRHALDVHPSICCRGEGHLADALYPLLSRAIGQHNERSQKLAASLGKLGFPCEAADFTRSELEFLAGTTVGLLFGRWADDEFIHCIGEKTPENALSMELLSRMVPAAKFVHVIRDGRDETVSTWEHSQRLDREAFAKRFPSLSDFTEVFVKSWNGGVGKARAFGRANRGKYLEVRCERLAEDPEAVFKEVLSFIGIGADGEAVSLCAGAARQAAGEDVCPGRWRDLFDDKARAAFKRHGGELLKLLEYDD